MTKTYKAAMIVIGNEILSGRTQDKNINYVAKALEPKGIALSEVRIVPDIEDKIIRSIHDLRGEMDYIFTSGGIGPTHDDITAECVAKAHDVEMEQKEEAFQILLDYYGEAEFTPARQKMAQIPVGASLIPNPVSAAPGFVLGNVHVMAGVPRILQAMVDHVVADLVGGGVVHSRTVECDLAESVIAPGLGEIQNKYPNVDIGSYPRFVEGSVSVQVVLRSMDEEGLAQAATEIEALVANL